MLKNYNIAVYRSGRQNEFFDNFIAARLIIGPHFLTV